MNMDALDQTKADLEKLIEEEPVSWWRPHEAREVASRGWVICRHWIFGFRVWETIRQVS